MISRRGLFAGVGALIAGKGVTMPEQLVPDSMAATIADMQRRLQILESTQRVGINRARFAWSTADATVTAFSPSVDNGPAAATWAASDGTTGTGYPRVTVEHGRKLLLMVQSSFEGVATDPTFRSAGVLFGSNIFVGMPAAPAPARRITFGPTTEGNKPGFMLSTRADWPIGTNTFQVSMIWDDTNPAAVNLPKLISPLIAVIPID